jgi:hypothetical protein
VLFELNANYRNDLMYVCLPDINVSFGYDSSSYAAGLLRAVRAMRLPSIRLPLFPSYLVNATTGFVKYPGWSKPVPVENFRPR